MAIRCISRHVRKVRGLSGPHTLNLRTCEQKYSIKMAEPNHFLSKSGRWKKKPRRDGCDVLPCGDFNRQVGAMFRLEHIVVHAFVTSHTWAFDAGDQKGEHVVSLAISISLDTRHKILLIFIKFSAGCQGSHSYNVEAGLPISPPSTSRPQPVPRAT